MASYSPAQVPLVRTWFHVITNLERKLRNLIDRFLPRIVRNIFGQ
jgi:hypothetical protein